MRRAKAGPRRCRPRAATAGRPSPVGCGS
jgi:hypothetical protein